MSGVIAFQLSHPDKKIHSKARIEEGIDDQQQNQSCWCGRVGSKTHQRPSPFFDNTSITRVGKIVQDMSCHFLDYHKA
jgi:hypothetical protein